MKRSHHGEERASRPFELARGGAVSVFSWGAVGLGRNGSGRLEGMSTTAEDILKQVRALPERERLRLVERIVHEVAERMPKQPAKPPLADLTDDEFRELQGAIEEARSMPLRTPG